MSVIVKSIVVVAIALGWTADPGSCLEEAALLQQDAGWERALLEGDTDFLESRLADDFVWVHDHASVIDSRESLLGWVTASRSGSSTKSREQSEVETRRAGSTSIAMGYTVVNREQGSTRYRFMRTYAEVDGKCLLLANQTMVIPTGSPGE